MRFLNRYTEFHLISKLIIKNKIDSIDNIDENNFIIENYNHYPTIKAEMVA